MKITVRGFVDGKLHFEELIDADINDPAALRPAIEKCTEAVGHFAHHMIEMETLDESISPGMRVMRLGPDAPTPPSAIQRALRN